MFENKEKTNLKELNQNQLNQHIFQKYQDLITTNFNQNKNSPIFYLENQILSHNNIVWHENIHFDLVYTPLKHLGYKIITASASHILGNGIIPSQISLELSISSKFTLEALEELYFGFFAACQKYNIKIINNIINTHYIGISISVNTYGFSFNIEKNETFQVKENDLIVTSGDLGGAYLGLLILEREKRIFKEQPNFQPDIQNYEYIIQRQLKPELRLDIIELLKKLNIKPKLIANNSNGLSESLKFFVKKSSIGINIYEHKLPIDQQTYQTAINLGIDPTIACLNGGDDFELLMIISNDDYEKIKNNSDLSIIGHTTSENEQINLISKSNNIHKID